MGGGQAAAVALGLVLLVLAGLYVVARSYGEKLDDPKPIKFEVQTFRVAIPENVKFTMIGFGLGTLSGSLTAATAPVLRTPGHIH